MPAGHFSGFSSAPADFAGDEDVFFFRVRLAISHTPFENRPEETETKLSKSKSRLTFSSMFSPELMVEPVYSCLDADQTPRSIAEPVISKLGRLHAICIGPGLGRHKHVFEGVKEIIQEMIRSHLGWLVVWGGVFGAVIGLVSTLI